MTCQHRRCFLGVLVLGVVLTTGLASVQGEAPKIPDEILLSILAYSTEANGATASVGSASGGTGVYLLAGGFDAGGNPERSLCVSAVGAGSPDEDALARSVHGWRARFEVLAATMEQITLRVDWSRETAARAGSRQVAAGDVRTITIKEGQSHTIDFLKAPEGSTECGTSLRVDLSALIAEDERFADKRLAYDLWLVDEAPGQPKVTKYFAATARPGERVDFSFPSLRWPVPDARLSDGQAVEVAANVNGSLRGRLRPDGSMDLYLEANRDLGLAPVGATASGGVGDGGRKALRLESGDVLNLVLPEPQGTHVMGVNRRWSSVYGTRRMTSYKQDTTGLPGGIELTGESIAVHLDRFLAGHTLSLRLAAREITD